MPTRIVDAIFRLRPGSLRETIVPELSRAADEGLDDTKIAELLAKLINDNLECTVASHSPCECHKTNRHFHTCRRPGHA